MICLILYILTIIPSDFDGIICSERVFQKVFGPYSDADRHCLILSGIHNTPRPGTCNEAGIRVVIFSQIEVVLGGFG